MKSIRLLGYSSRFQRLSSYNVAPGLTVSVDRIVNPHPAKCYSVWPSYFIHPVFRAEEQEKLKESGEAARLAYLPVKVAMTDETASVFYDPLYEKFVNHIMREGKDQLARTLLEKTFEVIKKVQLKKYYSTKDPEERAKIILNPYELMHRAVENGKPFLETTPIKRGGHTYQVPVPIREKKQQALAIKWLVEAGQEKEDDMRFFRKLAYEIIDAANNSGRVIKRKQELHKKCEANRAYAHYRWG